MRRSLAFLLGIIVVGCAEQSPTAPAARAPLAAIARNADLTSTSTVWERQITGESGPGAFYAFYVPVDWNGDVVYYAHGIVPAAMPLALPTGDGFPAVRDALGQRGYAVAYSSWSENGWAVKDGAKSTYDLRTKFAHEVGTPKRSYLVGTSLGGLAVQRIAEQHGDQYDGTLAMCAPLGGAVSEINYIGNVRVLFDLFYPGVIPGDVLNVPPGLDLPTQVIGPVQAAVIANPTGLGIIARMKQTPLAGDNGAELLTSLIYAISYDVGGIDDFLGRTHGHSMFDNSQTVYEAIFPGLLPASLLAYVNGPNGAGRFTATPDAINYLEQYYVPSGTLRNPTITLHTTKDPLVPYFHEGQFAQIVGAAGAGNLLQRSVPAFGHCNFTTTQMTDAFDALAGWVSTGIKPAS